MPQKQVSGLGEPHLPGLADEERKLQLVLQIQDPLGERRLRDMQRFGRPGEVQRAGHLMKRLKLIGSQDPAHKRMRFLHQGKRLRPAKFSAFARRRYLPRGGSSWAPTGSRSRTCAFSSRARKDSAGRRMTSA